MSDQAESGLSDQDLANQSQNGNNSGGTGDSPTSPDAIKALKAELREELREDLKREVQSTKDKRIAKLETSFGSLADRVADYMEAGASKAEALRNARIDELLLQDGGEEEPEQPVSTPNNRELFGEEAKKAASSLRPDGISDEDWKQVLSKLDVRAVKEQDLAKFVIQSVSEINKPKPNEASQQQRSGGGPTKEPTGDELVGDYTSEMTAARGDKSLVKSIKEKYRELGVDVDNIGFNV